MLPSLKLDTSTGAFKLRDKGEDPTSNPGFAGLLALLAGGPQALPPVASPLPSSPSAVSPAGDAAPGMPSQPGAIAATAGPSPSPALPSAPANSDTAHDPKPLTSLPPAPAATPAAPGLAVIVQAQNTAASTPELTRLEMPVPATTTETAPVSQGVPVVLPASEGRALPPLNSPAPAAGPAAMQGELITPQPSVQEGTPSAAPQAPMASLNLSSVPAPIRLEIPVQAPSPAPTAIPQIAPETEAVSVAHPTLLAPQAEVSPALASTATVQASAVPPKAGSEPSGSPEIPWQPSPATTFQRVGETRAIPAETTNLNAAPQRLGSSEPGPSPSLTGIAEQSQDPVAFPTTSAAVFVHASGSPVIPAQTSAPSPAIGLPQATPTENRAIPSISPSSSARFQEQPDGPPPAGAPVQSLAPALERPSMAAAKPDLDVVPTAPSTLVQEPTPAASTSAPMPVVQESRSSVAASSQPVALNPALAKLDPGTPAAMVRGARNSNPTPPGAQAPATQHPEAIEAASAAPTSGSTNRTTTVQTKIEAAELPPAQDEPDSKPRTLAALPPKASPPVTIKPVETTEAPHPAAASAEPKMAPRQEEPLITTSESTAASVKSQAVAPVPAEAVASSLSLTSPQASPERDSAAGDSRGPKHAPLPAGDALMAPVQVSRAPSPVSNSPAVPAATATFAQVEGTVRWMLHNHEQAAELQLHPDNLGRITISLKVDGDAVHARIWASEPTTVAALQNHRDSLQQSLQQQGLNLGSFDLQSGNRGEDARSNSPAQASAPIRELPREIESMQDVPMTTNAYLPNPHRIEFFA